MRTDRRSQPVCLKYHALRNWVSGHLGAVAHEERVASISSTLFDLTWPLHGLGASERRLLACASLVHDVGRAVDDDTHPEEGAKMVSEAKYLPLTPGERRWLAFLTRYHRGKVPPAKRDEILKREDDHERLRVMLALLRSADALDSRVMESPRLVFAMEGRRLRVTCYLDKESPKARRVYRRRKKFRLLEELLECRVEVDVMRAKALQMVA